MSEKQGFYSASADALHAAITKSRKVFHPLAKLESLLPSVARWDESNQRTDLKADPTSIAEAVVDLQERGLVEVWADAPKGPAVVLSPWSAEQLGIQLDGTGLRWQPINGPRRTGRNRRRDKVQGEYEAGLELDQVVDSSPVVDPARNDMDGRRPSIFLGERLVWNGPDQMHGRHYSELTRCLIVCPGCLDAPPLPGRTCLCCHEGNAVVEVPRKAVGRPRKEVKDKASAKPRKKAGAAT